MRHAAIMLAGLAGLAGLSGCAAPDRPLTDQDYCARQAVNDPAVKDLLMKAAGSPYLLREGERQRHAAEQDAQIACLRKRGIIPPGGVERPK